jgi:membrane protease YdiL (CAAX protease family)
MKLWGYLGTLGWAGVALLLGQFVALAIVVWWARVSLHAVLDTPYDGAVVTLFILISNAITIAIVTLAVRLKGDSVAEYLALNWTSSRYVVVGILGIVVLIAGTDGLLFLSGRPLVTPFQIQSYTTSVAENWLPAMLVATILVAPVGEEILFRGFLFRGLARTERSTWPAIVVISALWAGLHIQYDWTGILQIFVTGLFLGWLRWRSASVLLTFALHALFNLEGTIETVLKVKYFS